MEKNYLLGKHVRLGEGFTIGMYVSVGVEKGNLPTLIGKNSTIRSHSVIYGGNQIGDFFQTGHGVLIREENQIGNNVSIGSHTVIEHHVRIGNNVRVHSNAFIPEYSVLEDDCWVGPNVVCTNAKYPKSVNVKKQLRGPIIKKGAKIGAHVTILPGIMIGENALVGAGSVVTKDVSSSTVVVGNPANPINTLDELPYV